jgi:hypothetical protein
MIRRLLLLGLASLALTAPAQAATVHASRVAKPSQLQTAADAYVRLEVTHPTDEIRWCKRLGRSEIECHLVFWYPHRETIIGTDGTSFEAEVMWSGWRQIIVTPRALRQIAVQGPASA